MEGVRAGIAWSASFGLYWAGVMGEIGETTWWHWAGMCLVLGCSIEQRGIGASVEPSDVDDAAPPAQDEDGEPVDADEPADARDARADRDGSAGDASLEGGPRDASAACSLAGTRALRIEAQARWTGSALLGTIPIILPGLGSVQITALLEMQQDAAGQGTATVRPCGALVPDFLASIGELYGVRFPEPMWERIEQRWQAPFTQACSEPGCAFSTPRIEPQLGIALPARASWPGPLDPLDSSLLRDDDRDAVPGITLEVRASGDAGVPGYTYAYPPADYLLLERARELMIALRIGVALEGELEACGRYGGLAPHMSLETRALSCRVQSGNLCRPDQVRTLNENLPVWEIQRATFRIVDLPAGAGCSEARAAFP